MEIRSDVFDIARRLKEIDPRYRLYYRPGKGFSIGTEGVAGELRLPFDALDARTVEYVRRTRVERSDCLRREIEEDNRRAEAAAMKDAIRSAEEQIALSVDKVKHERA